MTVNLLEDLRGKVPSLCERTVCEDAGCSASLEGVSDDRLLIDLDCEALELQTVTHADFILATADQWLACIELKGGTLRGAERQLQASAEYAEVSLLDPDHEVRFHPVLVHRQVFSPARVREWTKRQVRFRGRDYAIRRIRCGEALADVFV